MEKALVKHSFASILSPSLPTPPNRHHRHLLGYNSRKEKDMHDQGLQHSLFSRHSLSQPGFRPSIAVTLEELFLTLDLQQT
jgi:hypothetical protein